MLRFGGVKALTKHVHDDALRYHLTVEPGKVEVVPQTIDNRMTIARPAVSRKPKGKVKVRMVKAKVTAKKSALEKVAPHLYDLEDSNGPEKPLGIDFGLYQMENY